MATETCASDAVSDGSARETVASYAGDVFLNAPTLPLAIAGVTDEAGKLACFEDRVTNMLDEACAGLHVHWLGDSEGEGAARGPGFEYNPPICDHARDYVVPAPTLRAWLCAQLEESRADNPDVRVRLAATLRFTRSSDGETRGAFYVRVDPLQRHVATRALGESAAQRTYAALNDEFRLATRKRAREDDDADNSASDEHSRTRDAKRTCMPLDKKDMTGSIFHQLCNTQ